MAQTQEQGQTVFVGRKQELKQLHGYLRETIDTGRSRVVLVEGDYGLGKTTLVTRFLSEVADSATHPRLNIGKGECMIGTRNSGLAPFIQLMQATKKEMRWKPTRGSLWSLVKRVAPAWLDIITAGVATTVVTTAEETEHLARPVRSSYSHDNIFLQFANTITELSRSSTVLAWIEDLHWADEMSLMLFDYLANRLRDAPLLIIGTYRPVEGLQTEQYAKLFSKICISQRHGRTVNGPNLL